MIGYSKEKVLKEYYEKNSHPKKYELEQLSQILALDSREVENWFKKSFKIVPKIIRKSTNIAPKIDQNRQKNPGAWDRSMNGGKSGADPKIGC